MARLLPIAVRQARSFGCKTYIRAVHAVTGTSPWSGMFGRVTCCDGCAQRRPRWPLLVLRHSRSIRRSVRRVTKCIVSLSPPPCTCSCEIWSTASQVSCHSFGVASVAGSARSARPCADLSAQPRQRYLSPGRGQRLQAKLEEGRAHVQPLVRRPNRCLGLSSCEVKLRRASNGQGHA